MMSMSLWGWNYYVHHIESLNYLNLLMCARKYNSTVKIMFIRCNTILMIESFKECRLMKFYNSKVQCDKLIILDS